MYETKGAGKTASFPGTTTAYGDSAVFELTIDTDNAAFLQADTDFNPREVARILRDLAANLEDARTSTGGALRDCNGDIVGQWSLTF